MPENCRRSPLQTPSPLSSNEPDRGRRLTAVVAPAPGVEGNDALAAELPAHCAERLARFKGPKSIEVAEELPREPNGQVHKAPQGPPSL